MGRKSKRNKRRKSTKRTRSSSSSSSSSSARTPSPLPKHRKKVSRKADTSTVAFTSNISTSERPPFIKVPRLNLTDGRGLMPAIALGTYLGFDQNGIVKSKDQKLRKVVERAIETGYRHFDTAAIYKTESEVGQAIQNKISEGEIVRDDIFLTTKVWNTHHTRQQVLQAIQESLQKLNFSYVDLYLMHWPIGLHDNYTFADTDYLETWRGIEEAYHLGLTKAIGVSNFNQSQLQRVLDNCSVRPHVLQIEVHPLLANDDLVRWSQTQGLTVMGYSALKPLTIEGLIDHHVLKDIAGKYGKTSAQVALRWQVERGIVPIAKTLTESRLRENIDIFDFHLEDQEVLKIDQLNKNQRLTLPSFWQTHPFYPFEKVKDPISDPFRNS